MYGHRKRVRTESGLWEKKTFSHRGIEPASAVCRSDARVDQVSYIPTPLQSSVSYKRNLNLQSTKVLVKYWLGDLVTGCKSNFFGDIYIKAHLANGNDGYLF